MKEQGRCNIYIENCPWLSEFHDFLASVIIIMTTPSHSGSYKMLVCLSTYPLLVSVGSLFLFMFYSVIQCVHAAGPALLIELLVLANSSLSPIN